MANNITQPLSPDVSLNLKLQTSVGRNQVQRNTGLFTANYLVPNTRVGNEALELAATKSYQSNPTETFTNVVLSCSGPLTFVAVDMNDVVITLSIKSLLALDSPIKSFTITNSVAGADTVRLSLNTVSNVP